MVSGSASVAGDRLCITVVNAHPSTPADLDLQIADARSTTAETVTLSNTDIHAHNTFADPDVVAPAAPVEVPVEDGRLRMQLPAGASPGSSCLLDLPAAGPDRRLQ